jgi:hypothetical protein
MSVHRWITQAGKRPPPVSHPRAGSGGLDITSAPVADVMFDQLKYLAAHAGGSCLAVAPTAPGWSRSGVGC